MLRKSLLPILFAVAVLVGPAMAEEVLYFTNGTSMPIVSHTLAEEMIEVVLGSGAFMAFPTDQIERIENAEGQIALLKGSGNQMVSGSTGTTKYLTKGSVPARHRTGKWRADQDSRSSGTRVETGAHGVAVIRPFAGSANDAKSRVQVAGRREIFNAPVNEDPGQGLVGTRRVGSKYVIPTEKTGSSARKVQPVGLTARGSSGGSRNSGDSGKSGEKK